MEFQNIDLSTEDYGNPFSNDLNKADVENGLHPCKLTGEFNEDNPQYTEVVLTQGLTQFARILYPFPLFAGVTNEWISKYADKLIGYCAFEKGYPERLLLVSVAFKEGVDISDIIEGYPKSLSLVSEIFKLHFNDGDNEAYIGFDQNSKLKFGKNATESVPLGNKLQSTLNDLTNAVKDLVTALNVATWNTPSGPTIAPPINVAQFNAVTASLNSVTTSLQQILSDNVYTE